MFRLLITVTMIINRRWRENRDVGAMPAVLESSHPLMQRFQDTLKRFIEKENAIAEEEILNLV